ncbi:MAG: acetylxylan esterase, partial [Saprospiraceae bacterium]|nr:acetylxylan esterase [Saprospiraceae bacterium]
IQSKADWQERQKIVRDKLDELLLPHWEKTPLNPIVAETIDRSDFTVEKIIFESFPDYPVSAALFLPKNRTGSLPAILFCSGHSNEGFRSPVYQHMIINYVKKGFAVFAFDPVGQGERNQYFKEDGIKKYGPTHEHSYVGNQIFLSGITPAQFFVWDGIRAIDYLLSRPEIDPERIGVTGRSGGGTQSAYLMAVDDRIKAAAPECYLTSFSYLLASGGPQDAEQNIVNFLKAGLDLADLVEVRAPKPTLMVTTTRDIFSIQGARELYEEAKKAFNAYNEGENLQMVEDDAPHQSTKKNREATYAFFRKHLNNPGSSEDEEVEIFSEEELWVSQSGQLFNDGYHKNLFSVQEEVLKDDVPDDRNPLKLLLPKLIGFQESITWKPVFSGATQETGYTMEKYLLLLDNRYHMPVVWLKPKGKMASKLVIYLDDQGKAAHQDSTDVVFDFLRSGYEVVLADLSGYGEMFDKFGGDASIESVPLNIWYGGILTGRFPAGIRVGELSALQQFAVARNPDNLPVTLIGRGNAAIETLMAVNLGISSEKVILQDCIISAKSLRHAQEYPVKFMTSLTPTMIRNFDIPQLIKHSPVPVKVLNPVTLASQNSNLAQKIPGLDVEVFIANGFQATKDAFLSILK